VCIVAFGISESPMAAHVSPCLIEFQVLDAKIANAICQELFATLAREDQQPHDRVAVDADDPLHATDTISLDQELKRQQRCILRNGHHPEQPSMRFRKGLPAVRVAETLEAVPVLAEPAYRLRDKGRKPLSRQPLPNQQGSTPSDA
jgi:hypothetical protein